MESAGCPIKGIDLPEVVEPRFHEIATLLPNITLADNAGTEGPLQGHRRLTAAVADVHHNVFVVATDGVAECAEFERSRLRPDKVRSPTGISACAIAVNRCVLAIGIWHFAQTSGPTYPASESRPLVGHHACVRTRSAVLICFSMVSTSWARDRSEKKTHEATPSQCNTARILGVRPSTSNYKEGRSVGSRRQH